MTKKLLKGVLTLSLSLCLLIPVCSIVQMYIVEAEVQTGAEPYSIYRWVYKEENGKTYMRLWDGTYYRWITDWILVEE